MKTNQPPINRRDVVIGSLVTTAVLAIEARLGSAKAASFSDWVANFRSRALARGISGKTYDRVMIGLKPDTAVYALEKAQPEFTEELWQYVFRRTSGYRVKTGKERMSEHTALFARIEKDYGVDRHLLCGLWGMESSFGDVVTNPKYMRPIIPALAALAYGEPRRRKYWETELLNALTIVDRGWEEPANMQGSWAGAMGHTQWMPEVWLNVGIDYNKDGKITPFEIDDAFAGTARYLIERGKYQRGEAWGCEVNISGARTNALDQRSRHPYAKWHSLGVTRADGKPFPRPNDGVKFWQPVRGGPAFLVGQNFFACKSYNPSSSYALALCHLGDRIRGEPPFRQLFPGGEARPPTLDEMQELQRKLTEKGFDTQGADGRVGNDTLSAVRAYQRKIGMQPADGYAGLKVLARLRQG